MKIWRSTNPNNINVWFGNELRPVTLRFWIGNKLGTELLRAFVGRVADRNDSDILDFFQRWQVALFDDIPGADETYIQFSATHWHGMLCLTRETADCLMGSIIFSVKPAQANGQARSAVDKSAGCSVPKFHVRSEFRFPLADSRSEAATDRLTEGEPHLFP